MKVVYWCFFLIGAFFIKPVFASHFTNELMADIKAYCQYIEDKNNVKKSLLMSPDVIVRAQNSTNDFPYQNNLIAALSKDLIDYGKSSQIKSLISDECRYYQLTQEAKLQIQFAIPNIKRQALRFKLKKIQAAKINIKHVLDTVQKRINDKNDTLINWYKIDTVLQKLNETEREIQADLAIQQPTFIKSTSLQQLLKKIWVAENKRQATLNELEKLRNWSLQVQAGAQQSLSSISQNQATKPYAALFFRYNLGAVYSNYKTDKSLTHYTDWKVKQVNGTQRRLSRLIQSITLLKSAEEQRLDHLTKTYRSYYGLTRTLGAIGSSSAHHFKQQIEIDQLMMEIEMSYLTYFIHRLNAIT